MLREPRNKTGSTNIIFFPSDFAAQFDPQPMHTEDAAARAGFFGRLVASGWHTVALTMRLMVEARPLGAAPLIGARVDELRFTKPVEPGARLRVIAEVTGKGPSRVPGHGRISYTVTTLADEAPVLTQKWTVLAPLRAG
jgi:acyl dehydratase